LGSLDNVTRIIRLGVVVATSGDVREQPRVADGAVSCDVVAVNEGGAKEPAMASPIDDSGDGAGYVELFEPAQKIEQLLRDGFMQGFSLGVAKATMIRLLQAERRRLSG